MEASLIEISEVMAGSVVVTAKVGGLASEGAARALAAKLLGGPASKSGEGAAVGASDQRSPLAAQLAAVGLGACSVAAPVVLPPAGSQAFLEAELAAARAAARASEAKAAEALEAWRKVKAELERLEVSLDESERD